MQVTLVSHYGPKPPELADYLRRCQTELGSLLSSAFAPYAMDQI